MHTTRTKGWRLAQRERKIAKRRGYINYLWRGPEFKYGKLHKTVTPCSCDMCSHDRRHYGPTLKERATADLRPEIAEWYASVDEAWTDRCEDMDMSYDPRVSLAYEEWFDDCADMDMSPDLRVSLVDEMAASHLLLDKYIGYEE